jgi:hypothetical protein
MGRNKVLKITALWYVTTCSLLDVYGRFRRKCCLHFHEECVYLRSYKISVNNYQNTRRHIAGENYHRIHVQESHKSDKKNAWSL